MAKFSGGCLCGNIRYEVSADPIRTARCHCDDCRRSTGATFATNVFVPLEALTITKGATAQYQHKTDSGATMTRMFCPDCGSPLFGYTSSASNVRSIRVGTIDDASFVKPQMEVYTSRALPCTKLGEDTTHFEKMRPA